MLIEGIEAQHLFRVTGDHGTSLVLVDYDKPSVQVYLEPGDSFSVADEAWLRELKRKMMALEFRGHHEMLSGVVRSILADGEREALNQRARAKR